MTMRIYFATDIHGSEVCWRKFLNAGRFYNVDTLILGGDVSGKAVVPVVAQPGGGYLAGRSLLSDLRSEIVDFRSAALSAGRNGASVKLPRNATMASMSRSSSRGLCPSCRS